MNRISKRVIAFLLTLVLMLSLCACAQMAQLWAGTDEPNISVDSETPPGKPDKKPPEKPRPGAGGSDVQPAQAGFSAEAEQSLIWLRDRIDFPQTMFGVRCSVSGLCGRRFEGRLAVSGRPGHAGGISLPCRDR